MRIDRDRERNVSLLSHTHSLSLCRSNLDPGLFYSVLNLLGVLSHSFLDGNCWIGALLILSIPLTFFVCFQVGRLWSHLGCSQSEWSIYFCAKGCSFQVSLWCNVQNVGLCILFLLIWSIFGIIGEEHFIMLHLVSWSALLPQSYISLTYISSSFIQLPIGVMEI